VVGKDNPPGVSGDVPDEYVALVNREGDIKDLEGLKHKKLMVQTGGLGEVPMIWLDTILMKQGLPASRQFCGEVKLVPKASGAVLPVFFGHADACVVVKKVFLMMVELNPQIGKRLAVLVQSPSFPRTVSWFGKDWDKATIDGSRTMIMESNSGSVGRQFVSLMGYDAVVIWDPIILRPLEALLRDYDELCKKAKGGAACCDGVKAGSAAAPSEEIPKTDSPSAANSGPSGRTDPQYSKGK